MYDNKKCDKCGISNVGREAYIPELTSNNRFEESNFFSKETKYWFKMFVIILWLYFMFLILMI